MSTQLLIKKGARSNSDVTTSVACQIVKFSVYFKIISNLTTEKEKKMKWPNYLMLIRHDTSAYNVLRDQKAEDPLYQRFQREFETNPTGTRAIDLANIVWKKYRLNYSDAETPLVDEEGTQAVKTGRALSKEFEPPDIIFVSPYKRTMDTLSFFRKG